MVYGSSAAEKWPIEDEPEVRAAAKKPKPEEPIPHKLYNAICDDRRLNLADFFLAQYCVRRSSDFACSASDLKLNHGFGAKLFKPSIRRLNKFDYMTRTQSKKPKNGRWDFATQSFNPFAGATFGRTGFLLVIEKDDTATMPWRQAALLTYLRSLPPGFIPSAQKIAERFSVNADTVRQNMKPLIERGQVKIEEKRDQGRYLFKGYVATRPCSEKAPTEKAPTEKGTTSLKLTPPSLARTNFLFVVDELESYTFDAKSAKSGGFSRKDEQEGKGNTYKARKAAKEHRDIEKLYKRAGIECPSKLPADDPLAGTPFDRPATFEEAAKRVTEAFDPRATAGCEIDGDSLADLQFEDIGEAEIEETSCISDKALRQGIRKATGGKFKKGLLGSEGLLSARRMIARLMQEDMTATEAFAFLLAEIEKATKHKGRWFNGWKLISKPIGGNLRTGGFDHAMTVEDLERLAGKFRSADENRVINRWLFSEKGLAGLRKLIADHGAEAVNDAVMYVILGSKTELEIEPGHVRTWAYFVPRITQQSEIEGFERL